MNSTNSYLYHSTLNRFPNSQQLNDLNSTRSSTTSCSTSHCLSNQCLECTTILSTRNLNSFIDQTTNSSSSSSSSYVQNYSYLSTNSVLENSNHDEQTTTTRILSMNIPVENSNHHSSSILNIEIDDNEQRDHVLDNEYNEQLEVFVGFYRPGEYQRETIEDDDEEVEDENSEKSDAQKKEEQSIRELISDDDEGNEDQDFIEEDFGPNQDDEIDAIVVPEQDEQFNPSQNDLINPIDQFLLIQIDEDEDQGFGAQFNDDCQSSDDENNHQSTLSLNTNLNLFHEKFSKKSLLQYSQSTVELNRKKYSRQRFLSLPNLSINSKDSFEKIEHFIIDDQQPRTTISNYFIKKKSSDDNEQFNDQKKKLLRKSSEEILEISNQDSSTQQFTVDDAVRDVERRVILFDDEQARIMDNQSSIEQILQYFQINIQINSNIQLKNSSTNEFLLDYLQYRSQIDISAHDLQDNLLQYPEFASNIYCRFFPFWPPRDVDLLQWLSHWIKQGALPVAIMNMNHVHSSKISNYSSWQHRLIYGIEPRAIYLMNPIQIQSPQQVYEQLTVDSITSISRHDILQRYYHSPISLTSLAQSKEFTDKRWQTMNVLGQIVHILREDRQLKENETRNIPYRPIVTHVRIPSTCSSGILIFSKDYNQLYQTMDLPLRQ